jgi:branched-chain amino acid aminotransferase
MLSSSGHVAEAPGSCIFLVRKGRLITPSLSGDILEGITRETVIELARQRLGLVVEEREIDRSELYLADESFVCGTSAELTPIASFDGFTVGRGAVGPITRSLHEAYAQLVRGDPSYQGWFTPVYSDHEGTAS